MDREKIVIWSLCALIGITTIFDLWTAYSSPIFSIAETNPVYITYGVLPLTFFNFIYMVLIIRGLKKGLKLMTIFAFVMATLILSYGHFLGGMENIKSTSLYLSNTTHYNDKIKTYTQQDKINSYSEFVSKNIFMPYIISLIGFSIIMFLYEKRRPIRDQYVKQAIKLLNKGRG